VQVPPPVPLHAQPLRGRDVHWLRGRRARQRRREPGLHRG
jgi:hypothetical protein